MDEQKHQKFLETIAWAREQVAKWPKWKRELLEVMPTGRHSDTEDQKVIRNVVTID